MKAKYQKYYDELSGKSFASYVSEYSNVLQAVITKQSEIESSFNSSSWSEKGLETIKGSTLPSLKKKGTQIQSMLSALSSAVSKVSTLLGELSNLEKLENELKTYGGRWTFVEGGKYSQTEVSNHNTKIVNCEKAISDQEAKIDSIIQEINGISVGGATTSSSLASIASASESKETNTDKKEEVKEEADTQSKAISTINNSLSNVSDAIKKYIGNVDDPNSYGTVVDNLYGSRKDIEVIDPETGKIYHRDDTIEMKEGETKRLIVVLPKNTGMIEKITRTSAWKNKNCTIFNTKSDVDPDPNKTQWVNRSSNHWPDDQSLLHNNCYEWVVTSTGGKGHAKMSQTVEYTSSVSKGVNLKAMTRITFNVT